MSQAVFCSQNLQCKIRQGSSRLKNLAWLIQQAGFIRRMVCTDAVTLMMCSDARMPPSAWIRETGAVLRHSRRQVAQEAGKMPRGHATRVSEPLIEIPEQARRKG